jgi:competence protein ComEC
VGPSWLRRFAAWVVLAVACATTAPAYAAPGPPGPAPTPAPLRIDFIAVGQGDAALVTSPTGKTVLIDGGPKQAVPALTALLRARHATAIDLMLLTHPHADHLGGLATIVRTFPVRTFMAAPFQHESEAYERLLKLLETRNVKVRPAERGRTIDIGGGAMLTLLTPTDPRITRSRSDVNANSIVVRVDYRGIGTLFAADAEAQTERWLLASTARLPAQILKVAHHGSSYSSTAPFLRAVAPLAAVISVGAPNSHNHPTPEAIARLEGLPAHVYRTDRDGTVTVETDGARIEVTTAGGKREILRVR